MAVTTHTNCKHGSTKKARNSCRRIRSLVADYTPMSEAEISTAMEEGTEVTGWTVFDGTALAEGPVLREITGEIESVHTADDGGNYYVLHPRLDNSWPTDSPFDYSGNAYRLGNIRLAD